jgi:HAMP domain-containing protein
MNTQSLRIERRAREAALAEAAARKFSTADAFALLCGLVLLVAFVVLPWFNLKDGSLTGLNLLLTRSTTQGTAALFLVPVTIVVGSLAALLGLLNPYHRRAASLWIFLASLVTLFYYGYTLFQTSQKPVPVNYVAPGFWIALVAAAGLFIQIVIPRAALDVPFIGLPVKLLIGFTVLFSVVFAGAYVWFYTFATNVAMTRIIEDLRNTLHATASGVDVDSFVGLVKDGQPRADGLSDDPRYWSHLQWLAKIIDVEPRALTYSYVRGEKPREIIFIGSCSWLGDCGHKLDPGAGAKFKEHYIANSNPILNGLVAESIDAKQPYTDKWGSWISGYAPIKNARGESVGAVGVDFEASYVFQVQQAVLDSTLPAFVITYAILFVLVLGFSRIFTRPVIRLTRAAELIGEGNYEQDLSSIRTGISRDEIGILAEVFQIMVDKVRQREENLKQQVQELKIEIDEVKRTKQVGEIVESEFFKDLQMKARKIRERSQQTQSQASGSASPEEGTSNPPAG